MPIPEATIRKAKQETDLLALCDTYGLKLTRKGIDYFARCPWHQDDTPSLSITPAKGLFHCFGCGAKGNVLQFIQLMEGASFPAAVKKAEALIGKATAAPDPILKTENRLSGGEIAAALERHRADRLQTLLESAFMHMETLFRQSSEAREYMAQKRGLPFLLSPAVGSPLRLGFCTPSFGIRFDPKDKDLLIDLGLFREDGKPHFENCMVFPLRDAEGILRGLYGRRISGEGSHYFMRGERKGVFALHDGSGHLGGGFAKGGSDFAYITESVIDALSLHQIGIPSVLALHGVNGFTPCHEEWLKAKGIRTVYLLLDGDRPGKEGIRGPYPGASRRRGPEQLLFFSRPAADAERLGSAAGISEPPQGRFHAQEGRRHLHGRNAAPVLCRHGSFGGRLRSSARDAQMQPHPESRALPYRQHRSLRRQGPFRLRGRPLRRTRRQRGRGASGIEGPDSAS
jgi:DNA primase catalytic core